MDTTDIRYASMLQPFRFFIRYLHRVMNQTQVASPCCIYDTEQSTPVESPEPEPGDQSEASVRSRDPPRPIRVTC